MKKQIQVEMPGSWEDITLSKFLAMTKDMDAYADDVDAQLAFVIHHLTGLDLSRLKNLSIESFNILKQNIDELFSRQENDLVRFVTIDGIEYGFEPNLSKMSYGAYVDITKFNDIQINDNWSKIMNILYRPVEKKQGENYSIKEYDGNNEHEKWLGVGMNVHFGALFFLLNLCKDLLISTLNYTKVMVKEESYKQILEKSGELTKQLLNYQEEIYSKYKM